MGNVKLSELLKGTKIHWSDELQNWEKVNETIDDVCFYDIIDNTESVKQIINMVKDKEENKLSEAKFYIDLLPLISDVEVDLTLDEFNKKLRHSSIKFAKFSTAIAEYLIELIQTKKEAANKIKTLTDLSLEIKRIAEEYKNKDEILVETLKKQYENEKDTKKKQLLFVKWKKAESTLTNKKINEVKQNINPNVDEKKDKKKLF